MKLPQNRSSSAHSVIAARLVVLASWLLVAQATAQAGADRDAPTGFRLHLGVAGGFGQRDITVPTRAGDRLLESALFPALGVSLDGGGPFGAYGLFGIRFHYQTSVGLQATEQPAAGSGRETSLRSHHVEAGITPGLRFADSAESVVLRLFAGWGFRGLRAVTNVAVPQYLLHGLVLRPELLLPFSKGTAEVRLGPELQLISGVSSELRQLATSAANGFAWGAEIELSIKLTQALRLYIDYRESHVRVDSAWGQAFKDTERFATAGLELCN
jgi:hypothetical protein